MGLDMYAYVAAKQGQFSEFWDNAYHDKTTGEFVNNSVTKPQEIAYWRKHPNLHGWMEQLWARKGYPNDSGHDFNGVELEITAEDLDELEQAIKDQMLPHTEGFFFGNPSDDYYHEDDLKFIKEARFYLFSGLRVFYNSSW